jgi:hypothetical protein
LNAPNPKGIPSQSPGLRAASYPGLATKLTINPNGVASLVPRKLTQPRWGWPQSDPFPQGSFVPRNPGLEGTIPLGLNTRTIDPARARAAETLTLERTLSDLVNQAYALTPAEIDLMWQTAPPRMPIPPPATTPQAPVKEMAGPHPARLAC